MARAEVAAAPVESAAVRYEVGESLVAELLSVLMLPRDGHEAAPQAASEVASEAASAAGGTPGGVPTAAAGVLTGNGLDHERVVRPPELEAQIRGLWGDGECCFTELLVLADRAGVLRETDFDRVLAGLAQTAASPPRFEALESESPDDQVRFRDRIDRLYRDPDLRQRWLGLLGDVWAVAAPGWQHGRPSVELYAGEVRGKLARRTYADLEQLTCCDFHGMLPRLVHRYAGEDRPVLVLPTWFAHRSFVLSLPDQVLVTVAVAARAPGPTAQTRERARRFKALADPTRLAILEATGYRPHTIGELAQAMRVAQPTVSTHVRILRDAGLIGPVADGSRRLRAEPEALRGLVEESLTAIGA